MTKKIDTVIHDIDNIFRGITHLSDEGCEAFGKAMAELMKRKTKEYASPKPKAGFLRMSMLGTPDRKAYYMVNRAADQPNLEPQLLRSFLFGDIIEELLLFLCKEAGHTVTDEQREVEIGGIKGHLDCRIDGVLTDIKSASTYGFKKFKHNNMLGDDMFSRMYVHQNAAYSQATSDEPEDVAWLAMSKERGELALATLKPEHLPNIAERIEHLKVVIKEPQAPEEKCFEPIAEDNGNIKLAGGCNFCEFKNECWQDANEGRGLRVFNYSNGKKYLIHVEKTPRVDELLVW